MNIIIIQKGKQIGYMFSFSISEDNIYLKDICLLPFASLSLIDDFQIKYTKMGEEETYDCKVGNVGNMFSFCNVLHISFLSGTILQKNINVKEKEDHQGQIYNPYNDSWSWI